MAKRVLAFDFGGSSYRAIVGEIVDGQLKYHEIARYSNVPIEVDGRIKWDYAAMLNNILNALKIGAKLGINAIGIDTWGVDYALLKGDELINTPYHYRDARTAQAEKRLNALIDEQELYSISGIQPLRINTVCQLFAEDSQILQEADELLFMPDLFAYFLSGAKRNEFTIASTSGLLDVKRRVWNYDLIDRLGLPRRIFCPIIMPGETYGTLKSELARELGLGEIPIIAVCTHDTASAIFAIPTTEDEVFISSGTWSLMGVNSDEPDMRDDYFTNEGGYGGKVTYLRNIMGLWLMQETRRTLKESGVVISIDELEAAMEPTDSVIDPNAAEFELPCDMPNKIAEYCVKTNQTVPSNIGQTIEIIYKSLAMSYRMTVERLECNTGRRYDRIYIVGGGSKAEVLCQIVSDLTKRTVYARPSEATAIGNITVQLIALGCVDEKSAKQLIINSENVKIFTPRDIDYEEQYANFVKLATKQ